MKASRFNILVDSPKKGGIVLYNSLYGSLSVWNEKEAIDLKAILANPAHADRNVEVANLLKTQKNLIPDSVDEVSLIEHRKRCGIADRNRLDLIIMPTLDCNFACVYCYEKRSPEKMQDSTELAIRNWLSAQMPKYKVTLLHWFGGEPLICIDRVLSITKHAQKLASESGISLLPHITTNGYLLQNSVIERLLGIGIYEYQITVDGPPDAHDKLRVLRNGGATFYRVRRNIIALSRADERTKISLRINFNHTNLHSIPHLLQLFPEDVRTHLRVVFEPIFGHCALSATENISSKEISSSIADYYLLAKELGYDVVLGGAAIYPGKLVYCYAERKHQFVINYNGDVFKCSVTDFNPDNRVAYIRNDGKLTKVKREWDRWVNSSLFESKCYECIYLPLCMGGCRKMRLLQQSTGSFCSLVPTNTSHILKKVAFGAFADVLQEEVKVLTTKKGGSEA